MKKKLFFGIAIIVLLLIGGIVLSKNGEIKESEPEIFGDVASSPDWEPTPPEPIIPSGLVNDYSLSVIPTSQVEDDRVSQEECYDQTGRLYCEILYPEDKNVVFGAEAISLSDYNALQINETPDYISDGGINKISNITFEDTQLEWVNAITLYVRVQKEGKGGDDRNFTATLKLEDGTELITIIWTNEDLEKGWWTKWKNILPLGRWTPEEINNAYVEFDSKGSGNAVFISSVHLHVKQHNSMADNFDSYAEGPLSDQADWTGDAEFTVYASTSCQAGANCVKGIGDGAVSAEGNFTGDAIGSQSYYFMIDVLAQTNGHVPTWFQDDAAYCCAVEFRQGGDIYYRNGGSWIDFGANWTANTWHHVEVQWNGTTGKCHYELDDTTDSGAWVDDAGTCTEMDDVLFLPEAATDTNDRFYWDSFTDPDAPAAAVTEDARNQKIINTNTFGW